MKLLKHYNEGCPVVLVALVALERQATKTDTPEAEQQEHQRLPLERMQELFKIQGQHGNWDYDAYMFGMYNGMEVLMAIAEDRDPEFKEAPEHWLKQPTLLHTIPLVACPPELKYLAPGHTVGLRIVGRYTLQGVEIEESELV